MKIFGATATQAQRGLVGGSGANTVNNRGKGKVHAMDRSGWGAPQAQRGA